LIQNSIFKFKAHRKNQLNQEDLLN
jgi:hypothetical protein